MQNWVRQFKNGRENVHHHLFFIYFQWHKTICNSYILKQNKSHDCAQSQYIIAYVTKANISSVSWRILFRLTMRLLQCDVNVREDSRFTINTLILLKTISLLVRCSRCSTLFKFLQSLYPTVRRCVGLVRLGQDRQAFYFVLTIIT